MSRDTTRETAERVIGGVRSVYDLYDYEAEKLSAREQLAVHLDGVVHP